MNSETIKPPDPDAVLVVGDSFAFGGEVAERDTFPAQLEQLLKHPVLNAGAGGYGTDQTVLAAESFIPLLRPSFLVVSIFEHAIDGAQYKVIYNAPKPWFEVAQGELRQNNNPVPATISNGSADEAPLWGYSYLAVRIAERVFWRSRIDITALADTDPVLVTCMLLERMKAFADARKIPMLVLMLYGGSGRLAEIDRAVEKPRPLAVANCAIEAGIETLDLWEPLVSLAKSDPSAYYGFHSHVGARREIWGHLTRAGNAFVAQQIARRMQAMASPAQ